MLPLLVATSLKKEDRKIAIDPGSEPNWAQSPDLVPRVGAGPGVDAAFGADLVPRGDAVPRMGACTALLEVLVFAVCFRAICGSMFFHFFKHKVCKNARFLAGFVSEQFL